MSRLYLASNHSAIVDSTKPNENKSEQTSYYINQETGQKILYLSFGIPQLSTIRRRSLSVVEFACLIGDSLFDAGTTVGYLRGSVSLEPLDPLTATYNNRPALASNYCMNYNLTATSSVKTWRYASMYFSKADLLNFIQNTHCIGINGIYNSDHPEYGIVFDLSSTSTHGPSYITLNVGDSLIPYTVNGLDKKTGTIDPSVQQVFSWEYYTTSTSTFIEATQDCSYFNWKSLYDGEVHTINVPGQTNTIAIPANTFPTTGIEWWVTVQDQDGNRDNSSHYTLNTGDRETFATPIAPANNVRQDEKQAIEFTWSTSNALDHDPISSDLQYKTGDGEWQSLVSVGGNTKSYTAPANTFPNAIIYWRVRSSNQDGVAGHWSDPAQFTTYDPSITAYTIGPDSIYIPPDENNVFSWDTNSFTGTWITGADLQYRIGSGAWQALATLRNTDTKQTTLSANTLPVVDNELYWRVRVYNGDNVAGPWSSAAMFRTVDLPLTAVPSSPKNGAARDETTAIAFSWTASNNLGSEQTGAELQWKLSGGEWQTFGTVSGSQKSYTAPARTFPGNMIYWRVRAYNQDSAAGSWSSEASFSTIDAASVSTPISPNETIEDTDSDLVFRWSTTSSSGTRPTRADLQYSYDGAAWITLGQTDGSTSYTVPGGTIHAGTVQWRVRSYNRNGTAGSWSQAATFVAHAAPRILDITADGKPFTGITWQATDQQLYEIEVDEKDLYGPFFGDEKEFQLTDFLEDGTHIVKIRVQNDMSMYSNWGELTFSVLNVPGGEIHLTGDFDVDADLMWDDNSAIPDYLVYRDGKPIGETPRKCFSDRVALGEHTYFVVNRLANGYYSKSNEVECTLSTDVTQIALLSGGEWMPLEKSENTQQSQRFTRTRKVAYHHFSGDKNPTPEVGEEEELIGEFDVAWFYTEEGSRILKSLVGQALIIKSRGEEVTIAVLEGYTKVNRKHFRGFAFNVKQMEWKDYICEE